MGIVWDTMDVKSAIRQVSAAPDWEAVFAVRLEDRIYEHI